MRALVRTHGPFPAVAGLIRNVPIGDTAAAISVAAGAQEGLRLYWSDPALETYRAWQSIELDRPEVAIPLDADECWLRWPDTLRSTDPVVLRSFYSRPSITPAPWPQAGREEWKMIAMGELELAADTPVATGTIVDWQGHELTVGEESAEGLRRWSGLWATFDITALTGSGLGKFGVRLVQRLSSRDDEYIGWSSGLNDIPFEPYDNVATSRARPLHLPVPPCQWKIEAWNTHASLTATVKYSVGLSTTATGFYR